ncbi:MAG TPA: hypothetical protein PLJ78_12190 [Anaerolineae bacterium]|nr:hypothetical protein [Anaerolineae bacterium]HQK14689.1 hypothetical protein [Anaerolineae bacterium]
MSESLTIQANTVLTLLRRLPPRERLRVIAQALPEAERELEPSISSTTPDECDEATLTTAETAWEYDLLERGLLSEIPRPLSPSEYPLPEPITVQGTPLSQHIIAERR